MKSKENVFTAVFIITFSFFHVISCGLSSAYTAGQSSQPNATSSATTISQSQAKCSDGMQAIFPCNQQTRQCDADPTLNCENQQGTFYCCDQKGASRTSAINSAASTGPFSSTPPTQNSRQTNGEVIYNSFTTTMKPLFGNNTASVTTSLVPECMDQRPDVCALISDMCHTAKYHSFFSEVCPRTCKLCLQPTGCRDKYVACGLWARNNFCQLVIYREETKRRLCGATCCMCDRNSEITNPHCPVANSTRPPPDSSLASPRPGQTLSSPLMPTVSSFAQVPSGQSPLEGNGLLGPSPSPPYNSSSLPGSSNLPIFSLAHTTTSLPSSTTNSDNSPFFPIITQQSTNTFGLTTESTLLANSTSNRGIYGDGQVRPRASPNRSNGKPRANEHGHGYLVERDGVQSTITIRRPRAGQ